MQETNMTNFVQATEGVLGLAMAVKKTIVCCDM
jgi:hypothetical protein